LPVNVIAANRIIAKPTHEAVARTARGTRVDGSGAISASRAPTPNSQMRVGVMKYAAAGFDVVSTTE